MKFKQSPVVFDEATHTYRLGEKRLLGITGLIHSVLGLGVYPEADDYVKDRIIPRAGSRGTAIHHAIQTYDLLGIRQTTQVVRTKYGCVERDNVEYADETWDVSAELDSYILHLGSGYKPVANEHTVSDNEKYASQIDNIWLNNRTGGIWLVDTKSNNIKLYPLCGYYINQYFRSGEDALKEYLSWQLSVYAELFETENPGLKVEGLACNWLREKQSAFWIIDRKPTELVKELLSTEYIFTDNGPTYFHHDPTVFGVGAQLPAAQNDRKPIVPDDVVGYVCKLAKDYDAICQKFDEAKRALRAAMEQHGITKCDFGTLRANIGADSTTSSFDTKKFQADHPDLYKQYLTTKTRKGSFTLKIIDND